MDVPGCSQYEGLMSNMFEYPEFNQNPVGISCSQTTNDDESQPERAKRRIRQETKWKKNISKKLRNTGKEYTTSSGVKISGKMCQPLGNHACRYLCKSFTEDERKSIFENYWKLGSWDLQTAFLTSCIHATNPKRNVRSAASHRSVSVTLKLKERRICKLFLLKTLDISQKRYDNVLKKRDETGISHVDKRGKHTPGNKISNDQVNFVKQHIRSFSTFAIHSTRRRKTQTKYLSADLNIMKMYALYTDHCKQKNKLPVKESYYRNIFNTKFNLRFERPRPVCENNPTGKKSTVGPRNTTMFYQNIQIQTPDGTSCPPCFNTQLLKL